MNILQIILLAITILLGYPVGRFIASQTKEELKEGKIYFQAIMLVCFVMLIASLLMVKGDNLILSLSSFAFIFLIAFASLTYKKRR